MCHLLLKLKKIIENGTEPRNTDIPIDVIRAANPSGEKTILNVRRKRK